MNKELGHFVDEFSEEDNNVFDGTAFVRMRHYVSPEAEALYLQEMEEQARRARQAPLHPEPEDFGGRCEDAPCCGCCGSSLYDSAMEYEQQRELYEEPEEEPEERDGDEWQDNDPEDRYLDSSWEDANEYGMEGCCGDF
jgi:hypothetical protein